MSLPSGHYYYYYVCILITALITLLSHGANAVPQGVTDKVLQALDSGDNALHIEIRQKRSVQLNGNEIDENSLLEHLAKHEMELIFGKSETPRDFKLVHLTRHSNAVTATTTNSNNNTAADDDDHDADDDALNIEHTARRRRRSATDNANVKQTDKQHQESVSVKIQDNEHLVNLQLQQTPKLIDDAFVYIRRNANSTQFIENSLKLAAQYERCFYRSENSALDLCDDESVRGVYQHNENDFVIQPLPKRFGNNTHVIYAATNRRSDELQPKGGTFDSNLQFEPDEAAFNEPSNIEENVTRSARNINNSEEHADTDNRTNQTTFNGVAHHKHSGNTDQHIRNGNRKSQHQKQQQQQQQQRHILLNLRYKPRYQHRNQLHHKSHATKQQHEQHDQRRRHHQQRHNRQRRYIHAGTQWKVPPPHELYIETAIFVDSDLYRHMEKNFPKDTESQLIRFVLAMINGVQLLYHHPTLGHRINFVLKRLEVFKKDPPDLRRSSDIDTYLSNFCVWQKEFNSPSVDDKLHYDHAVILTGLDLYVIDKNGKVISQVVGLAPVAGMCTATSSCTINEGKHFESVFVVAHEIGHNLGMRHDTQENGCDHTLHIMSPTLGSGKITWSKCSRLNLNEFLESEQSHCLFNRGHYKASLDHSAEGMLPGERFNADQQCMLKYGRNSVRAPMQTLSEICRDLHCKRDRYTWTSHPALEGTECGKSMWCRSGICVGRPALPETALGSNKQLALSKPSYEKSNFVEPSKMGQLLHDYNYNNKAGNELGTATWSDWGEASPCESGCLYGPSKRLREGSTGLRTYNRRCSNYRRRCVGRDRKFESCIAEQCYRVPMQTIEDFATEVCMKAQNLDMELTGVGQQIVGDIEESCKVFCKTKTNDTKSRRWTFPDGTTCRTKQHTHDDIGYCIAGRCEIFSCDNSTKNYYKMDATFCRKTQQAEEVESKHYNNYYNNPSYKRYDNNYGYHNKQHDNGNGIYGPTTTRNRYENEVAVRNFHGREREREGPPYKRTPELYETRYKYKYHLNEQPAPPARPPPPASASLTLAPAEPAEWTVKSGCYSSCMVKSKGVQVVTSRITGTKNIQLCTHHAKPCEHHLTASEYAENTCARYKLKVRGLSGHGTQIAASIDEPDRSCRVGCQDEFIKYRYYLVNGKYGHFPLGTKCSHTEERYCVNGKCLEFGADNIPLQESHISLALFRNRRSLPELASTVAASTLKRAKRSFLYYDPINITETITQEFLNNIVNSIIDFENKSFGDEPISDDHIEFTNPIHISTDELSTN